MNSNAPFPNTAATNELAALAQRIYSDTGRKLATGWNGGVSESGLAADAGVAAVQASRWNALRSSTFAWFSMRRRSAGRFRPARLISKLSIDIADLKGLDLRR